MPSESPTSSDVDARAVGRRAAKLASYAVSIAIFVPSRAIAASAGHGDARGTRAGVGGRGVRRAGIGRQAASPRLKNSRRPRIAAMRASSRSKCSGLSTKLSRSLLTISSGAAVVRVEVAAVGVGEAREVVRRDRALEVDAAPVHALDQRLDRRLQVDDEIGRRRLRLQVRVDLLVERVLGVGQVEPREQRILVEQEIGDRRAPEHVELADAAQLVDALEQERELRRQRVARHVARRSARGTDCPRGARAAPRRRRAARAARARLVLPAPIGPSTTM